MWGFAIDAFLAISAVVAPRKPKCPKTNSAASRIFPSMSGPGAALRPPFGARRMRKTFSLSADLVAIEPRWELFLRARRLSGRFAGLTRRVRPETALPVQLYQAIRTGRSRESAQAVIAFADPTSLRSRNFWILPVDVFGIGPNTTAFGVLKPLICVRQKAMISASLALAPSFNSTKAQGTSPHFGSGLATTAANSTAGCL